MDADATDFRFPVAVADGPGLRDVRVSVKCKPVSGAVDQACGVVWRYRNASNYYLARANADENNVRLCYVKDGRRELPSAGARGPAVRAVGAGGQVAATEA